MKKIFEVQKFESLQARIFWLDRLKTIWFQAELAKNLDGSLCEAANKVQDELAALAKTGKLPEWMVLPEVVPEVVTVSLDGEPVGLPYNTSIPEGHPLYNKIAEFMEMSTDDYPWWISFGHFWNEITPPACLEDLVDQLGEFYANQPETKCLGSERAVINTAKDGYAAISYYDISSELLVFPDEESALAFCEVNPVDPSELMLFEGGGWYCT